MTVDFEKLGLLPGTVVRSLGMLRLTRVQVGDDPLVLIADQQNLLVAVAANRLNSALCRYIRKVDFTGPAGQCSVLERMLGAGYVMTEYVFAEALSANARMCVELRPQLGAMLRGEPLPERGRS